MPLNLRGKPVDELDVDTHTVSSVGCGVISVILTGDGTTASTIKLYDTASESSLGNVKKQLGVKGGQASAIYCPCKPDAYSNGCVAVVAGGSAKAYVSVEP